MSTPSIRSSTTDPLAIKTLRKLFLTLFLRGRMSRGFQKETSPKSVWRKLGVVLLLYAVFGAFAASMFHSSVYVLSIYLHAMTTMVLGLFIAQSAGEVLFNKDESEILLHRPISSRVLLSTKISVLVVVSLWLAGAFNIASVVKAMISGMWLFPVAHIISLILETLFVVSGVVLLYQLCLRWFGRQRLDSLMTAVQVVMTVLFVAASQIIPRMMERSTDSLQFVLNTKWIALLPPAWFAGIDDAIAGSHDASSILLAGIGLASTGILAWLAFVKLGANYETGLQTISETQSRPAQRVVERRFIQRLMNFGPMRWWLGGSVARASFLLCAAYLIRDRDVKLRVFPGIAPMLVMPLVFLLQDRHDNAFGIAFAAGFLGILPLFAQNLLQYSQNWLASDLFHVAPMNGPAEICNGARRAVLLLLTVPLVTLFVIAVLFLSGDARNILLALPSLIALPVYAMIPSLGGRTIPLSIAGEEAKAASRGLKMFGAVIASMAFSGIVVWSWKANWYGWLLGAEIVVVGISYWMMRESLRHVRWRLEM